MGRITAIEPQASDANRFNIYVDNEFALGTSGMVAAKLRVGQSVSEQELAALEREEALEMAHEKALRFLGPRPRSTYEVRQHLLKKKIAADVIEQTLERLTQAGLLDDRAFAEYWVENREAFRPRASHALRFEMKRKGLSDDTIARALEDVDEDASAHRAGAARLARWAALDQRTFLQKMIAFLVRRGFSYETARKAAQQLWSDKVAEE